MLDLLVIDSSSGKTMKYTWDPSFKNHGVEPAEPPCCRVKRSSKGDVFRFHDVRFCFIFICLTANKFQLVNHDEQFQGSA